MVFICSLILELGTRRSCALNFKKAATLISGYTGGCEIDYATTDVISSDALQAIPSVEEFEAMARLAAEIADGVH